MRKRLWCVVAFGLMAGCSGPTVGGAAIEVTFDSAANAAAGRDDLANACQLTRITIDDHYGLRAAQYYAAPSGAAAMDTASACAKRFPHVVGVGILL